MNLSNHSRLRPSSLVRHVVVVAVAAVAAFLLAIGPAAAGAVTTWEGQGTDENGACSNVSGSGSVQTWHFILTQPGAGPFNLTAEFTDSGTKTDVGEQSGQGAVQFFVTTSAGDTLESAFATGGTANSVLTVSGCELSEGPPPTTTPPTTAPPTTAPPTTAAPTPGAPAAAAVTARAVFTG
jgi:hypothetical protein